MKVLRAARKVLAKAWWSFAENAWNLFSLIAAFSLVSAEGVLYLYKYHFVLFQGIVSVVVLIAAGMTLYWLGSLLIWGFPE